MDNDTVYVITEFTKVLLFLQRTTVRVRCFKFFTPGLGKCMFPMAGKANNNRKGCLGSSSPLSDSHPYTVGLSYTWQPVFLGTLSVDRRESMGNVHLFVTLKSQQCWLSKQLNRKSEAPHLNSSLRAQGSLKHQPSTHPIFSSVSRDWSYHRTL